MWATWIRDLRRTELEKASTSASKEDSGTTKRGQINSASQRQGEASSSNSSYKNTLKHVNNVDSVTLSQANTEKPGYSNQELTSVKELTDQATSTSC